MYIIETLLLFRNKKIENGELIKIFKEQQQGMTDYL